MSVLEYIVMRACESFGHNGNVFTTANFQSTLSKVTDSRPMITSAQADAILFSVPGVRLESRCHWRYEPNAR